MAQKDRSVRRVDERNDDLRIGGGELLTPATDSIVAPNLPSVPEPEDITIGSQTLLRTTLVPKVLLQLTWNNPTNLIPELYEIQAAKDSAFTTGLLRFNSTSPSAVLELNTDTDYWIRVRAVVRGVYGDWGYPSNYPTVSVHTIGDTTPPDEVTGVSTDWTTDDLEFTWTFPSSSNVFDARVRIYNTFGGTLYKEVYIPGSPNAIGRYVFRLADNNQVTGNNPLTSVYYTIFARSIAHVLSPTGVSGTATKTAPTKPTGVSDTWAADDGTYDESVTVSWTAVTGAREYIVIIDGLSKLTSVPFFTYNYTQNVADHRPTLTSGDHTLAYTVQARNGLLQTSPGASGTAINVPPLAANISLSTATGFSSLYAYVTHPKDILDLHHYTWTLSSGGATVSRVISQTPEITFSSLNGNYTLQVTATDMFGRTSNAVIASGLLLDGLTITQLRAETQYTNSIGTSPTTLAGLKDNNLLQSVVTIPSGTTWRWTKAERPLLDRYRTVTLTVSGAATNMPRAYVGISSDDSTYRWFSGPLVTTGTIAGNTTLTEYGTEVLAQNNAILISNINRFDFPSVLEGRYIKLGHRGNTHNLAEFYPRRLIQSDDIEAESIKGINIAAHEILADHISVINLQAVSAQMGNLHMDGVIDIASTGGIYQGTGSFASPTTGLKLYNSGGVGRLVGYNTGVEQVVIDTDGKLKAAGGLLVVDDNGIALRASSSYVSDSSLKYKTSGAVTSAEMWSTVDSGVTHISTLFLNSTTSGLGGGITESRVDISATSAAATSNVICRAASTLAASYVSIGPRAAIDAVQIGSTSVNANAGQLRVEKAIYSESDGIQSLGTNAGLVFEDRTTARAWQWYGTADFARLYNGSNDVLQINNEGQSIVLGTDAGTNNTVATLSVFRRSTGTVAAGFGIVDRHVLETDNGTDRDASRITTTWVTAADGTRKARVQFGVYDTAQREFFRGEANGTVAGISFFGGGFAGKQVVTGVRTGTLAQLQTVVANMLTALANYSLWTDSTT